MDLGSIIQFLENKTMLVIGAAGFLGSIFMEKILRVQPNVKKLYLLLRVTDAESASQRFHNKILAKDLFRVLKEKLGPNLSSLISEKVTLVPGDITNEDLGVNDTNFLEKMSKEVDIIVNLAATTYFDERYDVALNLNTLGAMNVLNFAKKCSNIMMLQHVSTAYVSGEKAGLVLENPWYMGETLNGVSGLDIELEKKVIEERLNELQIEAASEEEIKMAMKELGIQRARKYGWPNTYVFTKAMAEMLLWHFKENIPLVIIRPTIITSTFKEPFPGWVEGLRTIDSILVAYGKGKLTCFPADPESIIDMIPADMVVNAMIVAMAMSHANDRGFEMIYHVSSSVSNPIRFTNLHDYSFRYFTNHPWINMDGKPIKVGKCLILSSMDWFRLYMAIHYFLPLKALQLINMIFFQYFRATYVVLHRKIILAMRLAELYLPYLFFKGIFDDLKTEKLRMAAREGAIETDVFYFDPKFINWEDYMMNIHIPGLVKYMFK